MSLIQSPAPQAEVLTPPQPEVADSLVWIDGDGHQLRPGDLEYPHEKVAKRLYESVRGVAGLELSLPSLMYSLGALHRRLRFERWSDGCAGE